MVPRYLRLILGILLASALSSPCRALGQAAPIDGYVVRVDGGKVYLDFGEATGASPGQSFAIPGAEPASGTIEAVFEKYSIGRLDAPNSAIRAGSKVRLLPAGVPAPSATPPPAPPALPGFSSATAITPQTSTSTPAAVEVSTTIPFFAEEEEEADIPRPWVLGEIKVKNNKHVKFRVIRSQVKARKGDLYDRPDLDRDIQSILGLGNFDRVQADVSLSDKPVPEHFRKVAGADRMIVLTFIVKEKPLIRKIKFIGNKKLSHGALLDVIELEKRDPLDIIKLRDDEEKVLKKYRDKGYLLVTVESRVHTDTAALKCDIFFTVNEGPRSKIGKVTVTGVKAFKTKKILKLMKNRRKKVFKEDILPEDIEKIEKFYLKKGFLDVIVGSATVTKNEDKTKIFVSLSIIEGESYKFGGSSFSGHIIYTSTELARVIEYRKKKVFDNERFEESIRAIQELYADKGRLRARVTPVKTYNEDSGLMDIEYRITEGGISYIDYVDVEGNKATKTYVLRREVVVKSGEMFSAKRIRRSREKIMNLGFIDDVGIDIQPSPADRNNKVDVTFDITEGKPGLLTAGAAFSSVDGFIGTLSLQHLNLFGRAQKVRVEWSFGARVQDYFLSWTTPWVMNRPTSLGFDIFNTRRVQPFQTSLSAYSLANRGGTVRVGPRFQDDKYALNFSYTIRQVSFENVQPEFRGIIPEGMNTQSLLGFNFVRDTRDSIWDPTRGTRNTVGTMLSGGPLRGNVHFLKPSVANSWYKTLFSIAEYPFVLSTFHRLDYVTQFGTTKQVPINERFFIGGQDSLRGYGSNGEVGFPSGGKIRDIINIEFGFPLARQRRKTLVKFVFFYDIGSAWDRVKDMRLRIGSGEQDIKTNAGMGLRFTTPAFPVRLDWGYGFNHKRGEKKYQINFGLGNLF